MAVATIYTPDGNYPSLGIERGFNCLFLSRNATSWSALMVPWGVDKNDCGDGHITPGPTNSTKLDVLQQAVGAGFRPSDFPPVARWDRDKGDSLYIIGIRCGAAWCEIGKTGFQPSPGYSGPALAFDAIGGVTPSAAEQHRVQTIKGWYDVQRLAVVTAAGSIEPTSFRGFLIPHPMLDSLSWLRWNTDASAALSAFAGRGWINVGYAVMEGDYPKWNFKRGVNKIYFCVGVPPTTGVSAAAPKCPFPPGTSPEPPSTTSLTSCPPDPDNTALQWWAKTVSSAGTTYVCIARMDHKADLAALASDMAAKGYSVRLPATGRWRFLKADESSWYGCPTGCCTKQ
jgi:hypothetical protein